MTQKKTAADIEQRKRQVVRDATAVFLRYGYARTTMGDLAVACRLSRPSLYELFPGKEELFAEVVRELNREAIRGYREAAPRLLSLRSKLQHFCRDWGTHGLRLTEQHPDAKDLFSLQVPAVREMFEEFITFLTSVVQPESTLTRAAAHRLMFNFVYSLLGLETAARSIRHMEQMIDLQIDMLLRYLDSSQR